MKRTSDASTPSRKRPYRTPKLVVHGDLKTLTQSKGSTNNDGASKPKTRNTGSQA
jgi:hypothetical protein